MDQWYRLPFKDPIQKPCSSRYFPIAPSWAEENQLTVVEEADDSIVLARTGYTGSDGFESYLQL